MRASVQPFAGVSGRIVSGGLLALGAVAIAFVNPVLVILALAAMNIGREIPARMWIPYFVVSIVLFLLSRDFGVPWGAGANDDVPLYLDTFNRLTNASLWDVLFRAGDIYFGIEPGPHLFWWLISRFTHSEFTFLAAQYVATTALMAYGCHLMSKRYGVLIAGCLIALFPETLYSLSHIFRQQLALGLFFCGCMLIGRHRRYGWYLVALAPAMHVSALLYVPGVLVGAASSSRSLLRYGTAIFVVLLGIVVILQVSETGRAAVFYVTHKWDTFYSEESMFGGHYWKAWLGVVLATLSYAKGVRADIGQLRIMSAVCFVAFAVVIAAPDFGRVTARIFIFVLPMFSAMVAMLLIAMWGSIGALIVVTVAAIRMISFMFEPESIVSRFAYGEGGSAWSGLLFLIERM